MEHPHYRVRNITRTVHDPILDESAGEQGCRPFQSGQPARVGAPSIPLFGAI